MQRGRPRSPDRWGGGDPSVPGGWERERERSRSRSRSRSPRGGPGGGRYMGMGGAGRGGRGGGPGGMGPGGPRDFHRHPPPQLYNGPPGPRGGPGGPANTNYSRDSRSRSDASGSTSSSGDSGERAPRRGAHGGGGGRGRPPPSSAGPVDGPGPGPAAGGGAAPAGPSRREGELLGRVTALEAELASQRAAHDADRKKLEFVGEKVRAVAERSKKRGTMLLRLVAALRRVDGAKAGVEAAQAELSRAQEDLGSATQLATEMVEGEQAKFAGAASAQLQQLQPQAMLTGGEPGVSGAAPPPPPPGDPPADGTGPGGWSEVGTLGPDGRPKTLSFKLKIPTNV